MKKLIYIIPIMLLFITLGCSKRQHVFHTYYGDIDIDTMEVGMWDEDDNECYEVYYSDKDSFKMLGEWKYISGPIRKYYCPKNDTYFDTWPDNQGRIIVKDINPYEIEEELKKLAE